MSRTAKLLLFPLFLLQMLFFTFVALHRFVNGDEGFYLLATRLVLMHKKPYLDFFFPQAPLLPYVYALWMRCTELSWTSARTLSALLTALLGTLLYVHVCRQTRNWLVGLSAVVMFALSALIFTSFPLVTHYSLAGLFIFSGYVIVSELSVTSPRWLAAGGLLVGLSVDTRAYLLLLAPVFLWWIFHNSDIGTRLRSMLCFMGGFTVAMLPSLYLFFSSPDAFLFNNLGYHALRSNGGLIGMWREKFVMVLQTFLGGPPGNGIQATILFAISFAFVFSIHKRRYLPRYTFLMAIAIGFISLLPTPVYPQYFSYCIPFLVVSAVCVVNDLLTELPSSRERLVAVAACVFLLGVYLAASANDFRRYLITGDGVPGLERAKDKGDWKLQRVKEVSQAIDQLTNPGELVTSFWPGYVFQTKTNPLPGLENDFGLPISKSLNREQRVRYHILSPAEVEADFAAHRTRVVVLGNENRVMEQTMGGSAEHSLRSNVYILVRSIGDTSIYVCCAKP
jgi:Dolichyl-phosphate-mannose-protein mannosyltransferase